MSTDGKDDAALAVTVAETPELASTIAAPASTDRVSALGATQAETSDAGILPPLERVDRYVIKGRLGAGGMGVVYLATDPELGRDVAIKMIKSGASASRLRREAQALARLAHRNVVTVHDVGEHEGRVFIAMALVDGVNLREWMTTEHSTDEILGVLVQVADGIIAAHAAGMIHRDLKPDNIFVARDGNVLVGDFGLARDADDDDGKGFDTLAPANSLTQTGHVLGTPAYMAPEQAEGEASERSDQFSFCVTAYEALFGTRPFAGSTFQQILDHIDRRELTPPVNARKVPRAVERAIRRGLSPDPAARFASMQDLLWAMRVRERPRWPWIAGATGVAAIGATLAVVLGGDDPTRHCDEVSRELEIAWPAARRDQLAHTIRASFTATAAADTQNRLDSYRTRWQGQRRHVCIDAAQRRIDAKTVTARTDCLSLARDAFLTATAAMEGDARPNVLVFAERLAALPALEACTTDDAVRLALTGAPHHALMRDIAQASTAELDAFAALRARAEAAADLPAQLEISIAEARRAIDLGAYPAADAALARGMPLAEQLGVVAPRAQLLALAANSRCRQGRDPEAFLPMAQAAATRLDRERHLYERLTVLRARGVCAMRAPDPAVAIPVLEELLALSIETFGDGLESIEPRSDLALALRRSGRIEDAERHEKLVRDTSSRYVQDGTPYALEAFNRAHTAFMAGQIHDAVSEQQRGAQLLTVPKLRGQALAQLAMYHDVMLDWRAASETHAAALEALEQAPVDGYVEKLRAESLAFGGNARLYLGELDAAQAAFEQALVLGTKLDHTEVLAVAQLGLGRTWLARKAPRKAIGYLRDGLATHTKLGDAARFRVGLGQFALAEALWQVGEHEAARASARLAEASVAQGIEQSKSHPVGAFGLPFRTRTLDEITRWRDAHR